MRATEGEFKDTTGATIQMAWKHARSHHLITLRKSLPEHLLTHFNSHLMRLTYAGFKRIAPEHDLQMQLNEPFLTALEMFQHRSQ